MSHRWSYLATVDGQQTPRTLSLHPSVHYPNALLLSMEYSNGESTTRTALAPIPTRAAEAFAIFMDGWAQSVADAKEAIHDNRGEKE